ncbi:hypothetical protein C2845_PM12G13340 [Panicum miliaceum]|uniref:Uncharacterized protein n=1 Tax=Panicum miliaceum TaxID=4540 RepID=A0A3L6QD60_PANMI|nr:hypothetical protein C2845_PM12G13340 [Panicum miliaceum]
MVACRPQSVAGCRPHPRSNFQPVQLPSQSKLSSRRRSSPSRTNTDEEHHLTDQVFLGASTAPTSTRVPPPAYLLSAVGPSSLTSPRPKFSPDRPRPLQVPVRALQGARGLGAQGIFDWEASHHRHLCQEQRSVCGGGARCPKERRRRPQPAVARCANGVSAGDPRHDGTRCLEERWWLQLLAPRCRCRRGLLGHGHLAPYAAIHGAMGVDKRGSGGLLCGFSDNVGGRRREHELVIGRCSRCHRKSYSTISAAERTQEEAGII